MEAARPVSILEAALSEKAFAKFFSPPESWLPWFAAWSTMYGLGLTEDELALFQQCTKRQTPRVGGYEESIFVCGRRSGKSKTAALCLVYEALFGQWETRVGPGERFWLLAVATDKSQAGIIFSYVKSMLDQFRDKRRKRTTEEDSLIERETSDEIWLKNGAVIAIKPAAYRGLRGYSVAFACLDELAFFRDERSANPAGEIVASLLPSFLPGGRLLGISTPFAKFGLLWELFNEHYGQEDSEVLVWKAPTRTMNPGYLQSTIDRLLKRDRVLYTSEYLAEFRDDVGEFIPEALVNTFCVASPAGPDDGRKYTGFIDPSGGRVDSFCLGIAHVWDGRVRLDLVAEQEAPFDSPDAVVERYAGILHHYGITEVVSDQHAKDWVKDSFRRYGINVVFSDLSTSDLFAEFQPRLSSGQLVLLNDERLKLQMRQLERRAQPGGREAISHPQLQGYHDDLVTAAAGACIYAIKLMSGIWTPKEMDVIAEGLAKLKQESGHRAEPYMTPSLVAIRRAQELLAENEGMLREDMVKSGCNVVVRRGLVAGRDGVPEAKDHPEQKDGKVRVMAGRGAGKNEADHD